MLDEILARYGALPEDRRAKVEEQVRASTKGLRWVPNPGPQTKAYFSQADVLLYGGEPGGGKSQLILGLAFNEHQQVLVMRREYGDLDGLINDALRIHGSRDGFNGSPPPKLRIDDRHLISFAAAHRIGDEQGQMGKGRDLIGIDEATHFAESQVRFVMGWNRSDDAKQRCRVVMATNPPLRPEGLWVIKMFAPWLDPTYPFPAKDGELRWVISDEDGNDKWVDGPGEYETVVAGVHKMVRAQSRTYIKASVKDNPYYAGTGYEDRLSAMPEPWRSLLMGGFRTAFKDVPNQVIPTVWVTEAQKRWKNTPPKGVPMCAIGVDASGGGDDPMILARRYDGWFDEMIEVPGRDIPMDRQGSYCAGIIISYRKDNAQIVIDLGGGYGASTYEQLKANLPDRGAQRPVVGYKGAEGTTRRSIDGNFGFPTKRAAAYWIFREALDPGQPGGSAIALPPDPQLLADLTAPTFTPTSKGIDIEPKDKVVERLGRSTDRGDAVVMAWFEGPRMLTNAADWMDLEPGRWGMQKAVQVVGSARTPLSVTRRR